MSTTDQFIANVERDARVIEEIRQTLFVLELVNLAAVRLKGTNMRLELTGEIERLKYVLRMMGGSDDEHLPWTPSPE